MTPALTAWRLSLMLVMGCLLLSPAAVSQTAVSQTAVSQTAVAQTAVAQTAVAQTAVAQTAVSQTAAEGSPATASGADLYKDLSSRARAGGEEAAVFGQLTTTAAAIDWTGAKASAFNGNLRQFQIKGEEAPFYLIRTEAGELLVLAMPKDAKALDKGAASPYADLRARVGQKVSFKVVVKTAAVGGQTYAFAQMTEKAERLLLDRLFFIAIVLLLFLTMVGMGLTLSFKDFAVVFKKPTGMVIGIICQFGLLPLLAMGLGRLAGYHETYPFIFLGLILIAASPGGVTSNLMTYFGKGDVALSISLTAVCTVAAVAFTPLLLSMYGQNVPDFHVPVLAVFKQILVLVLIPLFLGMAVRSRWPNGAKRAEKTFAVIGLFALLFLVVVGVLVNVENFKDTDRYGLQFYAIIFALTFAGMGIAAALAKFAGISNFQIRAISLECGLRNASLAMTIALLLQDQVGDFYSSMFFTAGIFGLWMYVAGFLSIWSFKFWLPVTEEKA